MKKIPALIAAFVMTLVMGALVLAVGANALLNPNTVAIAAAPGDRGTAGTATVDATQVQQLQTRINEYQAREQQYQSQLNQATQKIQEANAEVRQYQQLFEELQQMGVIQVNRNGQIMVPNFRGDHD